MFRYRFHYKSVLQVKDALRHGVRTQHFKATIRWPGGFDEPETVTVEMIAPVTEVSDPDYGERASKMMYENMADELLDLREMVQDIVDEIGLFALQRKLERRAS